MPAAHARPPRWMERAALLAQLAAASVLALALLMLVRPPIAGAIDGTIASSGPLTQIITTPDLGCQVAHRDDRRFEFFGGNIGSCGTFLSVNGGIYGPAILAGTAGSASLPWTEVSQAPVSGSGSGFDPYRLVTVVDAADSGIRVEQTDSYVVGDEAYRTDVKLSNATGSEIRGILYRGGDCYLQDSDVGYGRVDAGAPACVISPAENAASSNGCPSPAAAITWRPATRRCGPRSGSRPRSPTRAAAA